MAYPLTFPVRIQQPSRNMLTPFYSVYDFPLNTDARGQIQNLDLVDIPGVRPLSAMWVNNIPRLPHRLVRCLLRNRQAVFAVMTAPTNGDDPHEFEATIMLYYFMRGMLSFMRECGEAGFNVLGGIVVKVNDATYRQLKYITFRVQGEQHLTNLHFIKVIYHVAKSLDPNNLARLDAFYENKVNEYSRWHGPRVTSARRFLRNASDMFRVSEEERRDVDYSRATIEIEWNMKAPLAVVSLNSQALYRAYRVLFNDSTGISSYRCAHKAQQMFTQRMAAILDAPARANRDAALRDLDLLVASVRRTGYAPFADNLLRLRQTMANSAVDNFRQLPYTSVARVLERLRALVAVYNLENVQVFGRLVKNLFRRF